MSDVTRLLLLGVPTIEGHAAAAASLRSRRRPLGVVALLATAGAAGMTRERLSSLLWPESDAERAGSSLRQTLFGLRRDLGADAIVGDTLLVRLNADRVWTDVAAFNAAADRGAREEAVSLYRGPFLDGFFINGLAELEREIEAERRRLARRALEAATRLAADAVSRGDALDAVRRWRRVVEIDPLGTRGTTGLLESLLAAGDRTGAIAQGRIYEALVRSELDADPDPSIAAILERLRDRDPARASARSTPASQRVVVGDEAALARQHDVLPDAAGPAGVRAADPGALTDPTATHPVAEPVAGRSGAGAKTPTRRWAAIAAIVAAVLFGTSGVIAVTSSDHRAGGGDVVARPTFMILLHPFDVAGGVEAGADTRIARAVDETLAASLDGIGPIRVVTDLPEAERSPASGWTVVSGTVTLAGGAVRIVATLAEHGSSGPPTRLSVDGDPADILQLVDLLALRIAAARLDLPRQQLLRMAALSTTSLAAFRAFAAAEEHMEAERYLDALEDFGAASRHDSSFALAYFRLSVAADFGGRDSLATWAAEEAERRRGALRVRDARHLDAYLAKRDGRLAHSERIYAGIVDEYPDDLDAWLQLADLRFTTAPLMGRSVTTSASAYERVRTLDPSNLEALVRLGRIASLGGNTKVADSLTRLALAVASDTASLEVRAFRTFALNDGPGRKRVTRELIRGVGVAPGGLSVLAIATTLDDVDGTEAFARSLVAGSIPEPRGYAYRMLAQMATARGSWRRAWALFDSAAVMDPVPVLEQRALLAAQSFTPASRAQLESIKAALEEWTPAPEGDGGHHGGHDGLHPAIRHHRLGLIKLRLGDIDGAAREVANLDAIMRRLAGGTAADVRTLDFSLRAHVAAAQRRPADALRMLDSAQWISRAANFEGEVGDRFLRARMLAQLGRIDEAAGWFESMSQRAAYELAFLAPSQAAASALYTRRGDRKAAARARARAAALWSAPDHPIQMTGLD